MGEETAGTTADWLYFVIFVLVIGFAIAGDGKQK